MHPHGVGANAADKDREDDFHASAQLSPVGDLNAPIMKRSQSLALPANMVIEPGARCASNRHSLKRSDIASLALRSQMHMGTEQAAAPLQRKPGKLAPRPRLTNQNLEPTLSSAWGNGKGLGSYGADESPRIKAGMA